jgi:ParB family chromosome partitioning protein
VSGGGLTRADWAVDQIRVGARHRKDLGDVDALADSIKRTGLLQPLTITPEGVLVCGARRLAAVKLLGWRQVGVWVRAGLSQRLSALMAERDDAVSHKAYTKLELAGMYEELKAEIAADAARRQRASWFGAETRNPRSDGVGNLPTPRGQPTGDSRVQAARMLGGQASHKTLEKIVWLKRVAAGKEPVGLGARRLAEWALRRIEDGASVDALHTQVRTAAQADHYRRSAADDAQPALVRQEAAQLAALFDKLAAGEPLTAAELEATSQAALARVNAAAKQAKRNTAVPAPAKPPKPLKANIKNFEWTWTQMASWTEDYDPEAIAAQASDQVWDRFKQTLAASIAFADAVDRLRAQARAADQDAIPEAA